MRFWLSFVLVLLLAMPVMAAKGNQKGEETTGGGFEGPVRGVQADTVDKALQLDQDARVALTGNIIASLAGEKNTYIFKDASGEINVLITPKQFKGRTIKPETKVQISGKIEKNSDSAEPARIRVNKLEAVE